MLWWRKAANKVANLCWLVYLPCSVKRVPRKAQSKGRLIIPFEVPSR